MKYIHTPVASSSGRLLARALRLRRIRGDIRWYPDDAEVVLNWGQHPELTGAVIPMMRVLNDPFSQVKASNKRITLQLLDEATIPVIPYTVSIDLARTWLTGGYSIVERGTVTGSGGHGIRVVRPGGELHPVPLYTRFMPSVREYRVHVIGDNVLPARKAKRNNAPDQEFPIRNHGDTWVFQYTIPEKTPVPESVLTLAKRAIQAVGLNFGAVDILYHGEGVASVLEINTAPGLDHTAAEEFYITNFRRLIHG